MKVVVVPQHNPNKGQRAARNPNPTPGEAAGEARGEEEEADPRRPIGRLEQGTSKNHLGVTVGSGIADAPIAVRLHAPTFPLHRKLSKTCPFQPVHQTTEPARTWREGANEVSEKIVN